jgi:hypothetical protein
MVCHANTHKHTIDRSQLVFFVCEGARRDGQDQFRCSRSFYLKKKKKLSRFGGQIRSICFYLERVPRTNKNEQQQKKKTSIPCRLLQNTDKNHKWKTHSFVQVCTKFSIVGQIPTFTTPLKYNHGRMFFSVFEERPQREYRYLQGSSK